MMHEGGVGGITGVNLEGRGKERREKCDLFIIRRYFKDIYKMVTI